MTTRRRWNHSIHYYPLIHAAVPAGCERVLDVGCGEGVLARELRPEVGQVCAIDRDAVSIDRARAQDNTGGAIDYIVGEFLTYSFPPGSFDLVVSVAALHHMDAAGLTRMRLLLRSGGTLVVVGLARSRFPRDLLWTWATT